jgi:hypothetical protein
MIKINVPNIEIVKDEYLTNVMGYKRVGPKRKKDVSGEDLDIVRKLFNYFNDNIKEIVLCETKDLVYKFEGDFNIICEDKKSSAYNIFKNYMVGQYNAFINENGNWLSEKLDVNVCPYCNRQFTHTIKKVGSEDGVRPQFDHFLPKSEYPYLALSFYNLIPCCGSCNSIKKDKHIDINPYDKGFGEDCKFNIDKMENCIFNEKREKWKIILTNLKLYKNHNKAFLLNDLYNKHKDYVEEIVYKAQLYNDDYLNDLVDIFSKSGLTEKEITRLIFGNYISLEEYGKRPLSKLTADILEQCDVVL